MKEIVYVLGTTRSGTSALRNALALTRFRGYGEGHLAPILTDLISVVRRHKVGGLGADVEGTGLNLLRENVLLRHLFHGYEVYLSGEIGALSLIDKTPTIVPIEAAVELNTLHKNPHFIHCARRHVDNVHSKIKMFPGVPFAEHCHEWAACNASWLMVRERLDGNFLDFDFYDLATRPAEIGAKIGAYLALDEQDTGKVADYLVSQRPQSSQVDRDLTRFLKLKDTGWTEEQKADFLAICGPIGKRLGYGYEDYFE